MKVSIYSAGGGTVKNPIRSGRIVLTLCCQRRPLQQQQHPSQHRPRAHPQVAKILHLTRLPMLATTRAARLLEQMERPVKNVVRVATWKPMPRRELSAWRIQK